MFTTFSTLREFHIEITNKCNAACPMCDRNFYEDINLKEWSKEDIHRVFDKRFSQLRNVLFCGTSGDPILGKNTLFAVEYIRDNFNASIEFITNGSLRDSNWWSDLGKLVSRQNHWNDGYHRNTDICAFSIDGLEDTNFIYRKNTNFEQIINNATSFIEAGGVARWDFIVFKHNQHQVEKAKELAKKIGFKDFRVRKTSRFSYSPINHNLWPVYKKSGELEYFLEPPDDPKYLNLEIKKINNNTKEYITNYFNNTQIDCLYKNKFNRLYINYKLNVFPCCYIGNDQYSINSPSNSPSLRHDTQSKVFKKYKNDFNSLEINSWEQILNHPWFVGDLEKSWKLELDGGRLMRCARTCGSEFSPILSQNEDLNLK